MINQNSEEDSSTFTVTADKFGILEPTDQAPKVILGARQVGMKEVRLPPPTWRARLRAWWRGEELPRTMLVPDWRVEINEDFLADGSITAKVIVQDEAVRG